MVKTMTMDDFNNYTTPIVGEVICVIKNDEKLLMLFTEDGWQEIKGEINNGIQMNLYDMNKQIISQLPSIDFSWKEIDKVNTLIFNTNNTFYLLYGKEIGYFTLFHFTDKAEEPFALVLKECLENVGSLKSLDFLDEEQSALEIWVENKNEATCLYLFPYDSGIVEVN